MRRTDVEAVGALAGDALAAGGKLIKDMHEGIAGRPFKALGPMAAPVRVIHDGVAKAVYGGVEGGLRGAARSGARVAARRAPAEGPPIGSRLRGSLVLGALNGLYGDHLAARAARAGRDDGDPAPRRRPLPADPAALRAAFPDATSRVVVFAHGLCETEAAWWLPARGADRSDRRTHGERLQDELSFTPVYLRYNTGLHVSDNGRALAGLLEALIEGWPVGVEELVLVGPLDGRPRRAQRVSLRREGRPALHRLGPPRVLPGHAAPRRRSREGGERTGLGARPAARDARLARVLNARSVGHQGPALRLVRRGGLVRLRRRRVPARPLPGGAVPARRQLLLRVLEPVPRPLRARCSGICSCACPAPRGGARVGGAGFRSRSTTATR